MIATPVLSRAHDGSRESRSPHAQNSRIIETNTAPPTPTLPEGKNLSRFLDAFLDGSFSIPSICDEFELTVYEVLALLESAEVQSTLETLKQIAQIRQDTIAAQARVTAIHRLSELATYAHTAGAVEARAFETARKSAAQIIRTTNLNRKRPSPRQHKPPAQPKNVPRPNSQQPRAHDLSNPASAGGTGSLFRVPPVARPPMRLRTSNTLADELPVAPGAAGRRSYGKCRLTRFFESVLDPCFENRCRDCEPI